MDNSTQANENCRRGTTRLVRGDRAGALADFDRALAVDPVYPEAYNNRGVARHGLGDLAGALADFDRCASSWRRAIPRLTAIVEPPATPEGMTRGRSPTSSRLSKSILGTPRLTTTAGPPATPWGSRGRRVADFDLALELHRGLRRGLQQPWSGTGRRSGTWRGRSPTSTSPRKPHPANKSMSRSRGV